MAKNIMMMPWECINLRHMTNLYRLMACVCMHSISKCDGPIVANVIILLDSLC